MNCHWVKDPKDGFLCFIPGCAVGVGDPLACTCQVEGSRLDKAEEALADAEETIRHLRSMLKYEQSHAGNLHRNNTRLRDEIRELRGLWPRKKIAIGDTVREG